ncbi:MAG: hypothetical protein ACE5G2_08265, partial [Candidatus Krumholzibacteriia bacterium]
MRCALQASAWVPILLSAFVLMSTTSPAAAFWPLTRGPVAVPDSVAAEEWEARLEEWKQRPIVPPEDESGESPTDSTAAGPGGGTPAPKSTTVISRASDRKPTSGAPPSVDPAQLVRRAMREAAEAGSPVDSLGAAAPSDSTAALADSVAAAAGDSAAADSLGAEESETDQERAARQAAARVAAERGYAPELTASLSSSNDNMKLASSLQSTFTDVSGISLTSSLSYGEDISLTQNTESETRSIRNSFSLPIPSQGLSFMLSTSNRRMDRFGTRSITQDRTRDATEDRSATLSGTIGRDLMAGLRANASYSRTFNQNEQDIAATAGSSQGRREHESAGNSFGFGARFDRLAWIKVRGRFGRAMNSNLDRSPSFVTAGNPAGETESTSEGDTASVDVDMPIGKWLPQLTMGFKATRSEESFTDVSRTSAGGRANETDFALETRRNVSRSFRVSGRFEPLKALSTNFSVTIARDSVSYEVRPNQFRDTKRTDWTL